MIDDLFAVGVEDVRPVFVIKDAGLVGLVIGVAADMGAPVDEQDPRTMLARQTLGEHRAGKAGADDQIIIFGAATGLGSRAHSAATSSAGAVEAVVPSSSAIRPAMRAWVVSQLAADSNRSASASQPLSGLRASSSAASQAATNSSAVEAILTPCSWP